MEPLDSETHRVGSGEGGSQGRLSYSLSKVKTETIDCCSCRTVGSSKGYKLQSDGVDKDKVLRVCLPSGGSNMNDGTGALVFRGGVKREIPHTMSLSHDGAHQHPLACTPRVPVLLLLRTGMRVKM